MKRRDFLKFGSAGIAGVALGGLTRLPLVRIGNVFAAAPVHGVSVSWETPSGPCTPRQPAIQRPLPHDPAGDNPYSCRCFDYQSDRCAVRTARREICDPGRRPDRLWHGCAASLRALPPAATNLYPHNIGFFPMRGNHETYGGEYGPLNGYAIQAIQTNFPQTQGIGTTWGAYELQQRDRPNGAYHPNLAGISYSFDYVSTGSNARFLMLDSWATPLSNPQSAIGHYRHRQRRWLLLRLHR